MKKILSFFAVILLISSFSQIASAESKKEHEYKKYSRVNRFLDTKYPMSKAAPHQYKK